MFLNKKNFVSYVFLCFKMAVASILNHPVYRYMACVYISVICVVKSINPTLYILIDCDRCNGTAAAV